MWPNFSRNGSTFLGIYRTWIVGFYSTPSILRSGSHLRCSGALTWRIPNRAAWLLTSRRPSPITSTLTVWRPRRNHPPLTPCLTPSPVSVSSPRPVLFSSAPNVLYHTYRILSIVMRCMLSFFWKYQVIYNSGETVFVKILTDFLEVKLTMPFGIFISSLIQGKTFSMKPRYSTRGKSIYDFKTVHNLGFYFILFLGGGGGVDLYKKDVLV